MPRDWSSPRTTTDRKEQAMRPTCQLDPKCEAPDMSIHWCPLIKNPPAKVCATCGVRPQQKGIHCDLCVADLEDGIPIGGV